MCERKTTGEDVGLDEKSDAVVHGRRPGRFSKMETEDRSNFVNGMKIPRHWKKTKCSVMEKVPGP